jgi:4-hydroxybutyrate dehydrogenase
MNDKNILFEAFGVKVEFGWGSLKTLSKYVMEYGSKKVLIVSDNGVSRLGILDQITRLLESSGMGVERFYDVSANPSDHDVEKGSQLYMASNCDLIIGVGGGSPMDAAKGIRVLVSHPAPLDQYYGLNGAEKIIRAMPPLIEIPTTAGTGSETSRGAVITNSKANVKCLLRAGMPSLALVDPSLTIGMPSHLTASTGMDALSHNIEAFLSNLYHPVAEAIAYEGIRLVAKNIIAAVENGRDTDARINMAMASSMGALAFQKGLGVTHSLSHQLSTELDIHHGVANAMLLPHTIAFNLDTVKDKMVRLAIALGAENARPEAAIEEVVKLNMKIGIPERLPENVPEEIIARMAQNAMKDWCHPRNPRPCTEKDMKALYRQIF